MVEWRVDTSETAVGAHETGSALRFSEALPAGLIGRSSTHRELYGVLRALKRWAYLQPNRTIRLCLDSHAAVRNLIKGGGPVLDLCNLSKAIKQEAEAHRLQLFPVWVRREENSVADKLSKAWERWYLLSETGRSALASARRTAPARYHGLPVTNVPFNQIQNVLHRARGFKRVICLIHPLWTAQSWWPVCEGATKWSREIGAAQDVLDLAPIGGGGESSALSDKPRWRMFVSIIDFTA